MPIKLKSRVDIQKQEGVKYYTEKLKKDHKIDIPLEIFKLIPLELKKSVAENILDRIINYGDNQIKIHSQEIKFLDFLEDYEKEYLINLFLSEEIETLGDSINKWILNNRNLITNKKFIRFLNNYYDELYSDDEIQVFINNFTLLTDNVKIFILRNLIKNDIVELFKNDNSLDLVFNNINLLNSNEKLIFLNSIIENEYIDIINDKRFIDIINDIFDFYKNYNIKMAIPILDDLIDYDYIDDVEFFYNNLSPHLQNYFLQKRLKSIGYDNLEDFEKMRLGNLSKYKNLQQKIKTKGEFLSDEEFKDLLPKQKQQYLQRLKNDDEELTDWEKKYLGESKIMNEGIKLKNGTLNESRTIISEDLKYHIEKGLSLNQNVFRNGSESYYNLINECRELFNNGIIELNEKDKELVESDLGKKVNTTHGWVHLDSPFNLEEIDETLETWGRMCESEYKGKKVKLNKPFRSSSGGKKYAVYVKNPESGNVKLIRFGDSGMRVGTNNKERVKSFVARHKCHEKKDKTKASYWACRLPQYGLVKYSGRFW